MLLGTAIFAALAWFIYAPALHGGFLWDDNEDIPDNGVLRLSFAKAMPLIWTGRFSLDYYPLKTSVQWLEWHAWGANPLGYHLVNLGLHVLSAVLIARILRRLGLTELWSWCGGALFLAHPIAVQSVAWMAELKDALALPLLLLSALAFIDFDADPKPRPLIRSFIWFIAALLAKSAVALFPPCLLLVLWWRHPQGAGGRRAAATLPYFAAAGILGAVTWYLQQHRSMAAGDPVILGGAGARLAIAIRVIGFYLAHTLWPSGLLPLYRSWKIAGSAGAACSWILVCLAAAALIRFAQPVRPIQPAPETGAVPRPARTIAFGLGWFGLNLLPVLGFVPISYMRFTWVMDHFAYFALVGIIGLAAAALSRLAECGRLWRTAVAVVTLAVIAALSLASRSYAAAYAGEEALWNYTVARDPLLWTAQGNLAMVRIRQGRYPEAEARLREALRLNPDYPEAHLNLCEVLDDTGRFREAIAEGEEALRLRRDYPMAELNLGNALAQSGRPTEALAHFDAGLRQEPYSAELRNGRGAALGMLERWTEAEGEFVRAVALKPQDPGMHNNLGLALVHLGRVREAAGQFKAAADLAPRVEVFRRNYETARSQMR